ncbi:MAG: NAD(P)/FAD-dependent oxidoreductase [Cyclobacteriaceae bacterium]
MNKDISVNKNLEKNHLPRVVVVGAGFAGINLIKQLSKEDVQLVLVDQNNYHTFQPLVYQVATASLEPGAISSPVRGMFAGQENFHFRMAEALSVDVDNYKLITSKGDITYDYLILANGAVGNYFGNEEVKQNTLTLNNLNDALSIREKFIENFEQALLKRKNDVTELMNVVIVGGGPTGVELAGALSELRKDVLPKDYPDFNTDHLNIHIVEGLDRLLPAMSEKSGAQAEQYLQNMGVKISTGKMVESYSEDIVDLSDGTIIQSNLVIWAAGVKGNTIKGFSESQMEKGSLKVDAFNKVVESKAIFAIGDVAFQQGKKFPKGLPKLAPVAIQQGNHLAKNFKKILRNRALTPFKYTDKGVMATIGRAKAIVELPGSVHVAGRMGWLIWVFVHLFSIIGLRIKLAVMAHWAWSYFTFDKGNRLLLNQKAQEFQK